DSGEISRVLVLNLLWRKSGARAPRPGYFCLDNAFALIEGGTIPPQSDSGEISRVLVLNLLWRKSGAHAPPRIFLSCSLRCVCACNEGRRSEERRVGKEWRTGGRSRSSQRERE